MAAVSDEDRERFTRLIRELWPEAWSRTRRGFIACGALTVAMDLMAMTVVILLVSRAGS